MRRSLLLLPSLIILMFANLSAAAPAPDEKLDYTLNSSRSSFVIRSGSGTAKMMGYQPDGKYGPGYMIKINYEVSVMLRGKQTGIMDIFVPAKVFDRQQFLAELAQNHPMSLGSFKVDYEGIGDAKDSRGNMYGQCAMTRVYDIDPMYRPANADGQQVVIMEFTHEGKIQSVSGLQIRMKVADGVPVLGAVQLDISGVSDQGIQFDIGMDMMPPR